MLLLICVRFFLIDRWREQALRVRQRVQQGHSLEHWLTGDKHTPAIPDRPRRFRRRGRQSGP